MDNITGLRILDNLNSVARHCNATYEAVNTQTATPEAVRANITLMRRHLDRIEEHLVNDTVIRAVQE